MATATAIKTITSIELHKPWRLEEYDPRKSMGWRPLRDIGEADLVEAELTRNELNKRNAPALVRIVRKTAF